MIEVYRNLENLPSFRNAVVTIGSFDGVHLGHQQIIKQMKSEAQAIGGETLIITFHPHPRKVVSGGSKEVKIINTLEEKINLLNNHGVEHLAVVPFNAVFANQTPGEYIEHFIVNKFHPHTIIIGYDHKFGNLRKGDYHLLEDLGEKFSYIVKEIPERLLNEIIVSSTKVRQALLQSDIKSANGLLGYEYFFSGTVVEGNKLGRTLGYPTANLQIEDEEKLIPGNGVYAVEALLENSSSNTFVKGMMNIGIRPTVDGTKRVIEVNLFDFDKDIYGTTLRVYVKHFLRGEVKFTGLDALEEQLAKDKEAALAVL